jgi:hypothetical protein
VTNEFSKTGVIAESEDGMNQPNIYTKKINAIFNNTPKGQSEADLASDGYGYLRSAIELCVEHEIFKGTVKRYQKNIALSKFAEVDGLLLNEHKEKLNELFERSSGFIKGHSNPTPVQNTPTLNGLKADFEIFKIIRLAFGN